MKKLAILSLALAFGFIGLAAHAHADAIQAPTADQIVSADSSATVAADPNQDLIDQIASLKADEKDPATGSISRFFIHLKIRKLENELNLKKALQ